MFRLPRSSSFLGAVILLLVILFEAYQYDYLNIFSLRPQSTHMWRKTDCASFALNYYNNGLNPFAPSMHNEFNEQGQSIGESPILYYLVGVGYSIFGNHEIIYRLFWFLMFLVGLFALQLLIFRAFKMLFWSIIIPALVFSIPIIAFYAIGFITNVPALAMVFVAWYFFYDFTETQSNKSLWWAVLFFFLAGWVKAPALISYLALTFGGLAFHLFCKKLPQPIKTYWPLVLPLVLNFLWYSWTSIHAKTSGNDYLSAKLFPLWEMSLEDVNATFTEFSVLWKADYLSDYTLWVYVVFLALTILMFWQNRRELISWIVLFAFMGFAGYVMLFFSAFEHHNYYGIALIFLIPLTLFYLLHVFRKEDVISISIGILCVWLLFQNIELSSNQQAFRYNDWPNVTHVSRDLFEIEPELDKAGIDISSKIISVPDYSPNMSLYLMNRRGLTNFNKLHYSPDSIRKYIEKGYEYAVINKPEEKEAEYLKPFLGKQILQKGEVEVFALKTN